MIVSIAIALVALATIFTSNAFVLYSTKRRHIESRQQQQQQQQQRAFVGGPKAASEKQVTSVADSKPNGFWDRLETVLFAPLETKSEDDNANVEDPRLLLAEWKNTWEERVEMDGKDQDFFNRNATATATAAEESLTNFLEVWARITLPDDKGLTTPVSPTKFKPNAVAVETDNVHYQTNSSMKLIFRPPKRYLSYKEQKDMEKGVLPDRKGAKVDAWSPGGVEVEVIMTVTRSSREENSILGVTARRCNIDGDTVIKKTSERAIVRRLENAIRIWKKSNPDQNG